MKKVLFVATVVRQHINVFHIPCIRWFHEQGWQVDVAANNDYEDASQCVIPYCDHFYCLPIERSPLKRGNLAARKQLKELLEREQYDIIHCHTPMGGVVARLAAGGARKRGTKVIYTAHGFHFFKGAPKLNWLVYYPIERLLARRTDLLITINGEDHTRAQSFKAKRVALVNGVGIDLERFTLAAPEERQKVRQMLGLRPEDTFAISAGRLAPGKNYITLLRAVKALDDPHFHLVICGDGELEAELKAQVKELGIEAQIHFLGFRNDVDELCKAADIFLFASLREGLPVTVMESMACGLPIVASTVRGSRELIDEGEGGYLVAPTDVDGFVDRIRTVMADEEKRKQMGEHNRTKIRSYSTEAVVAQMAALYESMM